MSNQELQEAQQNLRKHQTDLQVLSHVHLPAILSPGAKTGKQNSQEVIETLNRQITFSKMNGIINSECLSPAKSKQALMESRIYGT